MVAKTTSKEKDTNMNKNRFAIYESNENTTKLLASFSDWYEARSYIQRTAALAEENNPNNNNIENCSTDDTIPELRIYDPNGNLISHTHIVDALFAANDACCTLIEADKFSWISDKEELQVEYIANTECCMYLLDNLTYISRERAKAAAKLLNKDASKIRTLKLPDYAFSLKIYNSHKQKYETYEQSYMEVAQDKLIEAISPREADHLYDGLSYSEHCNEMYIETTLPAALFTEEALPLLESLAKLIDIRSYSDNAILVSQRLYTSTDKEQITKFKQIIQILKEAGEKYLAQELEESLEYQIWDDETEED